MSESFIEFLVKIDTHIDLPTQPTYPHTPPLTHHTHAHIHIHIHTSKHTHTHTHTHTHKHTQTPKLEINYLTTAISL